MEQTQTLDQPGFELAVHVDYKDEIFGGGAPRDVPLIPIKAVRWYISTG